MALLIDDETECLIRDLWPDDLGRNAEDLVDIAECARWEAVPCNDVDLSEWMQVVPNPMTGDRSRPSTVTHVPDVEDGNEDGAELYELAVRFHGFIERANLATLGNWDGSERGAMKAVQTLVVSGGGYDQPWIATLRALDRVMRVAANMAKPEQDDEQHLAVDDKTEIFMQRRVFVKANAESTFNIPSDAAHRGPELRAVGRNWHLDERLEFGQVGHDGAVKRATSVMFRPGHFVEVTAYVEIVVGKNGHVYVRLRPGKVVLVSTQGQAKGRSAPSKAVKAVKILKVRPAAPRAPESRETQADCGAPVQKKRGSSAPVESLEGLHMRDDYEMMY